MIIWGGDAGTDTFLNTGGRYDPVRDVWQPTTLTGAPPQTIAPGRPSRLTSAQSVLSGAPVRVVGCHTSRTGS